MSVATRRGAVDFCDCRTGGAACGGVGTVVGCVDGAAPSASGLTGELLFPVPPAPLLPWRDPLADLSSPSAFAEAGLPPKKAFSRAKGPEVDVALLSSSATALDDDAGGRAASPSSFGVSSDSRTSVPTVRSIVPLVQCSRTVAPSRVTFAMQRSGTRAAVPIAIVVSGLTGRNATRYNSSPCSSCSCCFDLADALSAAAICAAGTPLAGDTMARRPRASRVICSAASPSSSFSTASVTHTRCCGNSSCPPASSSMRDSSIGKFARSEWHTPQTDCGRSLG
mmetsp:Transcript_29471/g.91037  ORF Transcript_29471/g.91037 Transcript_29471/m.91037 type:complete len:281 (-) Transcript_29471:227-1069(-)